MFVYGGFSRNSECTFVIDKLNILDLKDFTWSSPISVPSRYNHSATLIGNYLYIFAGKDEIGNTVSDLISVDLASPQLRVSKLNMSGSTVLLKSQHFSEAIGNNLIVFGKLMDDVPSSNMFGLWKLDLKHLSWTTLDCRRSFSRGVWNFFTLIPSKASPPPSRELSFSTPPPTEKTRLIFLGNDDIERPQPYDHFRDLVRLDAECLGLWRPHQPTLASDFAKILEKRNTYDFTLFSRDMQEVGAHSIILLARWPHFCNIIESGMVEKDQKSLNIDGSVEAVRTLVHFLYTDTLDESADWEVVGEVLYLASFFILPRLSKLCCELLHRSLSIETCCQIFHFANMSEEASLQTIAVHFLLENFGEVVHSTDLASLPSQELKLLFSFIPRDAKLTPIDDI
ncbi:hypothetical protein DSO57_1037209 [Entomophthora muscae]|nr:hypothetical protein DSO57_1037209 [Entomophthora muscae]